MKLRPLALAAFCSIVISSFPPPAEAEGPPTANKEQPSLADQYRLALTVDPDNLNLRFFLGSALLAEGLENEAVEEFRRAYPDLSDSIEMNYNLGLACARTGDPDSALIYFEHAEALGGLQHPALFPLANAYYDLGLAYLETDAFEKAARLFTKALAADPERQEIHRLLGEIHARDGHVERALDELNEYLKIYPDDAATREYVYTLYFNRAQQSMEERDYRKARNDFESALAVNPGSPLAIYYLGYLDHTEGKYEEAAARLAKIYRASPAEIRQGMDSILYNSAQALLEQRKPREALAALAPLTTRQPAALKDIYLAGNIHLILKEFEGARTCFERVLAMDPSHRGAALKMVAARAGAVEELFGEGRARFRQGEYPEALRKLEDALAIHPAHPGVRACLEEIRGKMEDKAEALFALAEQSLQQDRPEKALEHIRAGLNLAPGSPLGQGLRQLALGGVAGDLSKALEEGEKLIGEGLFREAGSAFARALELDPLNEAAREGKMRTGRLLEAQASEIAARGKAAMEDGRLSDARKDFETALNLVPELREGKEGLARIDALLTSMISEEVQWGRRARSAGRLHDAREHFANALRLREDSGLRLELDAIDSGLAERICAFNEAARTSLEKGDFRRAGHYFEEALAESPQHPDVLEGLTELEIRREAAVAEEIAAAEKDMESGSYSGALSRYRHVLGIDPANRKALKGLEQGLKLVEGEIVPLIAAGDEAMAGGQIEEAETAYREALALDPFRREVRAAWEKVLILSPDHEKAPLNIEKARRRL